MHPAIETKLKKLSHKDALIGQLNDLRRRFSMPPYDPSKVKMSIEEIEGLIYDLENPAHKNTHAPAEPEISKLLSEYNALRLRLYKQPLKHWRKPRKELTRAIASAQRELSARALSVKKTIQPGIAEGANTSRFHTALHTNHTVAAMGIMRKKERAHRLRQQRDSARAIATWAGFHQKTCLDYLIARDVTRPPFAGEALKEDIKKYVDTRDKIMPKKRGRAPNPQKVYIESLSEKFSLPLADAARYVKAHGINNGKLTKATVQKWLKAAPAPRQGGKRKRDAGSFGPPELSLALKMNAKALRVRLRKMEPKIPKAWRTAEERWGFKPEHQKDIMRLLQD